MNYDILVLTDNRTGSAHQAIALAEELNLGYVVKNIEYNIFAHLPNVFLSLKPVHVSEKFLKDLTSDYNPKIIMSAGRRSASIGLYLKNKFYKSAKTIHIMSPGVGNWDKFDLIVLPQHDNITIGNTNVIRIIGALCKLKSNSDNIKFSTNYPSAKRFITVLIGGNTHNYKISTSESLAFCEVLKKIYFYHNIPFFISFSRRTPHILKKMCYQNFAHRHIIYDPEINPYNPYNEILMQGEYIIVSGDTISMCSEAAITGKPLYIYLFNDFKSKKHKFFIQQLKDLQIARTLDNSSEYLEKYSYTPLCEVKKVANLIKTEILQIL